MTERVIKPVGRGFLFLDSHPAGCERLVAELAEQVEVRSPERTPVALVVGASSGYGLAATIAGLARYGVDGVGVSFEKAPTARRTATAGWYRTAATAELADKLGRSFRFVNADAFADTTKSDVLDLVEAEYGGVDYLIYSVAAPRRVDPRTDTTYQSALRSIGAPHRTKSIAFEGTEPVLQEVEIEAATDDEIAQTVQVMGGEDWIRWVDALADRKLLRDDFTTVALTYIGSELTGPIYRQGSIGAAKAHLEQTAHELSQRDGVRALTSVNGAAVTQASSAIPGIGLYVSLLHKVLGDRMQSPMQQSIALWDQLTGETTPDLDEDGRLRLDRWELDPAVQDAVREQWEAVTQENIATVADAAWFFAEVRRLYGFDVAGVDYEAPAEVDVDWPAKA
ncbi:enoyl-[acyl-carrier protein] reductase/trans-2-enoyl-CoA reductase (NAD+) [Kribbella amoyensis]|uniref:trans-2-enoyl-CoA reductase (NAD(+)) n=1 Tax=Kribbella amoyensis TaxID=996641 RepID=A0A561B8P1_9ACTN|nr:enoyl-[acyl-carrier-protein] reductase FabV [Kribbella amoyensis]TWD75223.1 enoyl-[acyl-carrier protein] reductase/trans-2-enoyl-CoA reductase (NAD+) [Kribbella amoyensis]